MAVDYGLTVDKEGFNASMEEARQKARNARNKVMQKLITEVIIKTLFFILPLITGALAQL
jgi:alanyl-tRNA synthetase